MPVQQHLASQHLNNAAGSSNSPAFTKPSAMHKYRTQEDSRQLPSSLHYLPVACRCLMQSPKVCPPDTLPCSQLNAWQGLGLGMLHCQAALVCLQSRLPSTAEECPWCTKPALTCATARRAQQHAAKSTRWQVAASRLRVRSWANKCMHGCT